MEDYVVGSSRAALGSAHGGSMVEHSKCMEAAMVVGAAN